MSPRGRMERPIVGAHLGTSGGLLSTVEKAGRVCAEAVQIFSTNPRRWAPYEYPPTELEAFARALERKRLPLFIHSSYLINLASPDATIRRKSAGSLGHSLYVGAVTRAQAVVSHVGSHRGEGHQAGLIRAQEALSDAFEVARSLLSSRGGSSVPPPLLLETSAGSGDSLAKSPAELAALIARVPGSAGVCLDSAHLFAAGYPVDSIAGITSYLENLAPHVPLGCIGLVHLNDSRTALGSRHDQHENLGYGQLGLEGIRSWLTHPLLQEVPFILEVPGHTGHGPDRRNVLRARRLRRERS